MSYPIPHIDPAEKKHPADDYNAVRKEYSVKNKKKKMAHKMSPLAKLKKAIKESEHTRKHPFNFKREPEDFSGPNHPGEDR